MSFTLSGTTITQSGTDANCSGLSAIVGTATMTQGTEKTYNLFNYNLVITGTLNQDPDFEHLIFDSTNTRAHDITVQNGGVWNLGVATTANGFTKYSAGNAVISQRAMPSSGTGTYVLLEGSSAIYIATGGTWNYRGGYIKLNHTIFISGAGNLNMYAGRVQLAGTVRRFGLFSSGSVNITGGTFDGVQFLVSTIPTTFSGVEIINTQSIVVESANNRALTNIFTGLNLTGTATDTWVWFSSYAEFRNSSKGSGLNIAGDTETSQGSYTGIVTATQNVTVGLSTQDNTGIVGAVTYIRDTNNGSRYSGFVTFDYTADRVYINSTTTGGVTSTFNVLLGEVVKETYTQVRAFDIRGKTNVAGADLFDIYAVAYSYQPLVLSNTKLQSTSTLAAKGTMLTDSYVTLTEANAVTKLASSFTVNTTTNTITVTANSSLDDLYDVMKVYKTRAVQAQLEYPSIGVQPVTASGSVVSTTMAIVVNAGITLSAGTKLTSLVTTSTVTLGTGAALNAVYTDSTGTRSSLSITGVLVGSDVVIKTTASASGSGSNVLQTFDSVTSTTSTYAYIYQAGTAVDISIYKPGYKDLHIKNYTLLSTSTSLPVSQVSDRSYV